MVQKLYEISDEIYAFGEWDLQDSQEPRLIVTIVGQGLLRTPFNKASFQDEKWQKILTDLSKEAEEFTRKPIVDVTLSRHGYWNKSSRLSASFYFCTKRTGFWDRVDFNTLNSAYMPVIWRLES